MKKNNLEKYYMSMRPIQEMYESGVLSYQEYQKAEVFLADKYCIKKGNLYRLIHLTIPRNRVIYMIPEEEVDSNGKSHNQD